MGTDGQMIQEVSFPLVPQVIDVQTSVMALDQMWPVKQFNPSRQNSRAYGDTDLDHLPQMREPLGSPEVWGKSSGT